MDEMSHAHVDLETLDALTVNEDYFKKNFKLKGKLAMNDLLLMCSKFFCHPEMNRQLIAAADYLEPDLTYEDKLLILNLVLYGVLSLKKFGTPDIEDARLDKYLGRLLLSVVDGNFHKNCTEARRLEILRVYFSIVTHKDYLGSCFDGLIDTSTVCTHTPFSLEVSPIEDSGVGLYLAVIPLMKRLVDCFDPGSCLT